MVCGVFTWGGPSLHESDTNGLDRVGSTRVDGIVGAVSSDEVGALISFLGFRLRLEESGGKLGAAP